MKKDTLKKILTRARQGATEHERDTAQRLFEEMARKSGLTLADFEEVPDDAWFTYSGEYERLLLLQIVGNITNTSEIENKRYKGNNRKICFRLTEGQAVEVKRVFTIYKKDLKKALELAFHAFVQRNQIFSSQTLSCDDISDEEYAYLLKVHDIAENFAPSNVRRAIA